MVASRDSINAATPQQEILYKQLFMICLKQTLMGGKRFEREMFFRFIWSLSLNEIDARKKIYIF